MTCPSLIVELKSTNSFWMMPEIWLPTSTWFTELSCQLAATICSSSPRETAAVSYRGALLAGWFKNQPRPAPPASTTTRSQGRFSRRTCAGLIIFSHFIPAPQHSVVFSVKGSLPYLSHILNCAYGVFHPYRKAVDKVAIQASSPAS